MSKTRVRFAPSPTGMLHVGGLRTALYNYLFAKHNDGDFILRIEDTDQSRYVKGAEQDILKSLRWAGIEVDESPQNPGDCGPYRQSERKEMYEQYAEQLVENDRAYYAFDTTDELNDMRDRLKKSGNPSPKYDAVTRMSMTNSLTLSQDEVDERLNSGDEYVIRLKVPRRETIRFEDEIRGFVSFESKGLDDQVLLKSDGMPTYHMANIVDDHFMEISHVIRGEEWLSSTPKHILLYKYLGWEPPKLAHLPLIMSPSGGKLSKRDAETEGIPINAKDYRRQHFEPQALVNFLAYLGWSPGDDSEIHSMDELIDIFSLDRVTKGGAVYNFEKLIWYNEHYLREQSAEELYSHVQEIAEEEGLHPEKDYLLQVISLMKERVSKVDDFITQGYFFFEELQGYEERALNKWNDDSPMFLKAYAEKIEELDEQHFEAKILKDKIKETVDAHDAGWGKLMMPLRVAVSGTGHGPALTPTLELLGKKTVLQRIDNAIEELG